MFQFDGSVHFLFYGNSGCGRLLLEKLSVQRLLFVAQVIHLIFVIIGLLVLYVTIHGLEHF